MANSSSEAAKRIAENLAEVRGRIARAAEASGRAGESVTLVAVTKYGDEEATRTLAEAGCGDLGESRPQALWSKAAALADLSVRWHMVGHLQRNKIRRTLPLVSLLHSLDSTRLIDDVEKEAGLLSHKAAALLEVNVSGESNKHGFAPAELVHVLPTLATLDWVDVCGLMCMAALDGGADEAARTFASLRELRDRLQPECSANVTLKELSMGMSGDFEIAIREGATIVRIGSALFEGVTV